ncbi:MAG: CfrBI family restriction endonuclease [Planctomycetaceae bacterium]|nr:CfrBI family restriction endonuclease [Planctomycetaceae bacterium]
MMLTERVIINIVKRLISGQDYRIEVVALINAEFMQFAVDFFKKVIDAKLTNQSVCEDWYKHVFLDTHLSPDDIAIHSGLNKKTIHNMFNSATRQIVLDASKEHYETLCQLIQNLVDEQSEIDLTLTIKINGVSVDLNMNESLIVINTLAVKRAALRGGAWSTAGKQVEKLLMRTLCSLFQVPHENFTQEHNPESMREVDFYLTKGNKKLRCEVKLMGRGNPESADAIFARESDVFIGDKLSDKNKAQAEQLNVQWVELRAKNGYKRLEKVLEHFGVPFTPFNGDLHVELDRILNGLLLQ